MRYVGQETLCRRHAEHYDPTRFRRGNKAFGHAFQAWTVYQRIVLRLPYRIIAQVTEHLFGVGLVFQRGQLSPLPCRLLRPNRRGQPPGHPQERFHPRR